MYNTTIKFKLKANTLSEYRWKNSALSGGNLEASTERARGLVKGTEHELDGNTKQPSHPQGGVEQNAKFINVQVK